MSELRTFARRLAALTGRPAAQTVSRQGAI